MRRRSQGGLTQKAPWKFNIKHVMHSRVAATKSLPFFGSGARHVSSFLPPPTSTRESLDLTLHGACRSLVIRCNEVMICCVNMRPKRPLSGVFSRHGTFESAPDCLTRVFVQSWETHTQTEGDQPQRTKCRTSACLHQHGVVRFWETG